LIPAEVGWDSNGWDAPDASNDLLTPDHIVMEQGAADRNDWSRGNRWLHRDTVGSQHKAGIQAERSILQFRRDVELFNHDSNPISTVDVGETLGDSAPERDSLNIGPRNASGV
jgi:hypothetical protein